jgi:L-amino acid N-acyltransferase YncA
MSETWVRAVQDADVDRVAGIYNHYVLNTTISFEEQAVAAADMAGRIAEAGSACLPWLVAGRGDRLLGFAYASKWKGRCAYRHSVESTVYVEAGLQRQGIGSLLLGALLQDLARRSVHVVIGGIALPNAASVCLHERIGFVKVAHFRQIGFKFERWIDVGYWQKTL